MKKANSLRDSLNNSIKDNLASNTNNNENINSNNFEINVGMDVLAKPFNMVGTVLTLPNKSNEVLIQFGNTKTNIKIQNLEPVKKSNSSNNASSKSTSSFKGLNKSQTVNSEINVIGLTVDEAIFVVDKYLDDCYLANLQTAKIVHGKGTGKLKNGIHLFLKTHPHVKSFRLGTFGEGELGVTVVELK